MPWHDVTRKILGGTLGGPGKILGGQWPPWPPLAPPLVEDSNFWKKLHIA